MKKVLMVLFLNLAAIGFISPAMALPDKIAAVEVTGSQQIKATPGAVYSVNVTYIGATAGDSIKLYDSLTATGTARYKCVASGSSGTCTANLTVANYFGTGIYYSESKASGATFTTNIQYF